VVDYKIVQTKTLLPMIKNYLKVAMRNLLRNKVYVLINTFGMGIAMACCMTAYLLIAYNIEFDEYFSDDQVHHVVKLMHHLETSVGKSDQKLVVPMGVAPQVAQDISGIEDFTRFCNEDGIVSQGGNAFYENIRFADPSFFKMFKLGLARGSHKNFENQQSIFLSEQVARKYFDEKDPVGEMLTVELNNKNYEVVVGGVFEKLPLNISFNIDALMRIETYLDAHSIKPDQLDANQTSSTLFKLTDIDQRQIIGQQMTKYSGLINEQQKDFRSLSFELVPFTTPIINGEVSQSNLRLPMPTIALIIFSTLGFIILLIACFNLTNTTLALTGKRLKEIGVRKVVGSGRRQIVYQFLIEMVITISLAILAGLIMAQVIVPQFATMWQLQYGLSDLNKLNLLVALIVLLFIAALLAGIYPAVFNSRFNPIDLLKGGKGTKGTNFLTRSLLVIQFSLSVMVFIAGIVFTQNAAFQKNISLGYDKQNILMVSVLGDREYEQFKNEVSENPKIERIAGTANHIGPYAARYSTVKFDTTVFKTNIYATGIGYFKVVGLDIVAGRDFIEDNQTDYESAAIVDENFVLNHNLKNPIDAQVYYNDKPYRIVGVVKNHLSGLKQKNDSEHLFTLTRPVNYGTMVIRTNPKDMLDVRVYLEKKWRVLFPGRPFESKLQEDIVYEEANGYNSNLKQIFFFITLLGCLLSASGIYALASLNVQKRTKEIGIRKVLGASIGSIVQLLNKEFAIILALASLLGGGSGYFLTNTLLNDLYAQHIEIGFVTIVLCSLSVFIIGISTTSTTIFRTATDDPTKTLKNE
jgi:putative ABC transport system permease protein